MKSTASDRSVPTASRLERRRDRRKAQIVDVAIRMLATSGYQGTSLEAVADRADIAKATLYHYFSSKDELVAEAIETLTVTVNNLLVSVRDRAAPDGPRAQLRALIREQLRVLTEVFPEVGSVFSWQGNWPDVHEPARKAGRRRHDAIFRDVVDAGIAAGELDARRRRRCRPAVPSRGHEQRLGLARAHRGSCPPRRGDGRRGAGRHAHLHHS